MEIVTQFGTQQVDPDTLIQFPNGLPGFDNLTRFKLFHEDGKPTVFWLQAVDDPEVQLAIADPAAFQVTYELTLSDDELAILDLASPDDLSVLVTLAKNDNPGTGVHANFFAPILINAARRIGLQKALANIQTSMHITAS